MRLSDFQYTLPGELIAQYPLKKRDQARLMVIDRKRGTISHDLFFNLHRYLPEKSMVVVNDSKVLAARLLGRRSSGGEVEIFLLTKMPDGHSFRAMIRPLKRIKVDEKLYLNGGRVYAQLKDVPGRIVRFNKKDIDRHLKGLGHVPLPPYIKRPDELSDRKDYQTVYARCPGSVAAPTAGLHFTRGLLDSLQRKGHEVRKITLHVGDATFKPVQVEDIRLHRMHAESFRVSGKVARDIHAAKANGRKIVAVGTTSCRTLESIAPGILSDAFLPQKGRDGECAREGSTDLFIYPGYDFRITDALVTNFHLPGSTLLMLVCAFGGRELIIKAYQEAIREKYRFYSYGDAMVIV